MSPSCEFVGAFVWAPNPPKVTVLLSLFAVLAPTLLNGFAGVDAPNVNDPDGGAGVKLMLEAFEGGKEALVLKCDPPLGVLLPKGVEN